jgi:predicted deacylase
MKTVGLLFVLSLVAWPQRDFQLGGRAVPVGTSQSFELKVDTTAVPVTIFNGTRPGPVLTITAGIHGDEFPPILALQRLRSEIRPADLSGTLVLIHLANTPGFFGRSIARNPIDGKNLNREFPGEPNGTLTERLAHLLTTEVVSRTDYLVDMHAGSSHERLWPHVYSPFVGNDELDRRTLELARATGFRNIVLYGDRPRDPSNSISYPNTAMTRGKPGITIECGQLGRRDERCISKLLQSARNILRHLKMLPGGVEQADSVILHRKLHYMPSPATGLFFPQVREGEAVNAGALLAYIGDSFGNRIAEMRAPARGIVLIIYDTPPVTRQEEAITLAEW